MADYNGKDIEMTKITAMLSNIDRVTGSIDKVVQVTIVLVFVVLFALLNIQVAMRYVIRVPLIWLEELAGFLLAYLTMWGASSCIRTDRHIRVNWLLDRTRGARMRHLLSVLIHTILLFYLYYLVVYGYQFAALGVGEITPSGSFDFFLPRMALTSGGVLMMIQSANILIREFMTLFNVPGPDPEPV